jgi:hypothetical protein
MHMQKACKDVIHTAACLTWRACHALQYSISDYREKLYLEIVKRKKELRRRLKDAPPRGGGQRHRSSTQHREEEAAYAYSNGRQH